MHFSRFCLFSLLTPVMRFSETLRFNANPDWWIYYVPYEELKRLIHELQRLQQALYISTPQHASSHHDESTDDEAPTPTTKPMRRSASRRLLTRLHGENVRAAGYSAALAGVAVLPREGKESIDGEDLSRKLREKEKEFFEKVQTAKHNVDDFYVGLRDELRRVTEELEEEVAELSARLEGGDHGDTESRPLLTTYEETGADMQEDMRALRARLVAHYKELGETVNFSNLNRTAFDKVLKKHDKYTNRISRPAFMAGIMADCSFVDISEIQALQMRIEKAYGGIFKEGNTIAGRDELREGLRDLIIWDRNTIWRDVLRTERKVAAFRTVKGGREIDIEEEASKVLWRPKAVPCISAVAAFFFVMLFPQAVSSLVVEGGKEYSDETLNAAHRCLAVTSCVVILWAFEGVPLYVTSFLVIPLVVMCQVLLDSQGNPLQPDQASKEVFRALSSPTLVLIICVYALGAALSKFDLDKFVANRILTKIRKPHHLLLTSMSLAVIVSMFVSNVAAPVLLNSVMMPTIDAMSQSEYNRKYVRCLLLGIMAASNIGGFASPISSPQSAVALGLLTGKNNISFLKWLLVALPQCGVMVALFYVAFSFLYKPHRHILPPLPRSSEKFSWAHYVTVFTLFVTVLIWSDHQLESYFGSEGVVAVIPVLIFFGTGILKKEDFNNLPWDVVYLVAGGGVLGAAVESCKLLDLVAEKLTSVIGTDNVYVIYLIFSVFMALVANAVSHTVSAIIVLPLIFKIGEPMGHPQLLVLAGTFAASSAMALPVSSFPNISATQVEDEKGVPYLTPRDVLVVGSLMTFLAVVVLLTFGYWIMIGVGM